MRGGAAAGGEARNTGMVKRNGSKMMSTMVSFRFKWFRLSFDSREAREVVTPTCTALKKEGRKQGKTLVENSLKKDHS